MPMHVCHIVCVWVNVILSNLAVQTQGAQRLLEMPGSYELVFLAQH